jgi:uncharacterized protein (TIGR00251 family)
VTPWARQTGDHWLLDVRVQPNARRSEVIGPFGDQLKVRVAAPADAGKANRELVRFVAQELKVSRASVRIVRGHHDRNKTVEVTGDIDPAILLPAGN